MRKGGLLPLLTDDDIAALCTKQSFERGWMYFETGAIGNAVREGNVLRATCQGSQPEPYEVEVVLSEVGVVAASCTCPYDMGGFCKHIVALLLAYVHQPEIFEVVDPKQEMGMLASLSKEELIALVQTMLRHAPRLRPLVEAKLISRSARLVDFTKALERYRKIVGDIFRGRFWDYEASRELASNLWQIKRMADELAGQGDYVSAVAMLTALFETIDEKFENIDDSDGVVGEVAGACVEMLLELVPKAQLDTSTRHRWQEIMFQHMVTAHYGLGGRLDELLLRTCTPEDLPFFRQLTEQALDQLSEGGQEGWGAHYRRQMLVIFLADLAKMEGNEEEALALYRQHGLHLRYAQELLNQKRVSEAVDYAIASFEEDNDFVNLSEALVAAGHLEEAEGLIRHALGKVSERSWHRMTLMEMLAQLYMRRQAWNDARQLYIQLFQAYPSVQAFDKVKEASEPLGDWERVCELLIEDLKQREQHAARLIEIYLHLQRYDEALSALSKLNLSWYGGDIHMMVADAVRTTHPREAMRLYQELAEGLIEQGANRKAYQKAVGLLRKARECAQRVPDADWETYINSLRMKYQKRRALLEEMQKGLG